MLETLISLLVVIALILFILDYLGVIEIVQAFVGLILGAVWLIGKGLMYLYRRLFRASPAPPQGQDQIQDQIQDRIMDQAHYIVIGQYKAFGAYRKDRVNGWIAAPAAVFWNIQKK